MSVVFKTFSLQVLAQNGHVYVITSAVTKNNVTEISGTVDGAAVSIKVPSSWINDAFASGGQPAVQNTLAPLMLAAISSKVPLGTFSQ